MLGKKRPLGKELNEIQVGDTYSETKKMDDRDLLLYLGLTGDANPLYLQHDYASLTAYEKPIVPSVMLFGMVSSLVSMSLPGPGSHITQHEMTFPAPVYHSTTVAFTLEVIAIDYQNKQVAMSVTGTNHENEIVVRGKLYVCPACKPNSLTAKSLENFF